MPGAGFSPVRYHRDDSGLESDFIVEVSDGRWAAIEAKLSPTKVDQAASSPLRIRKKLADDALARTRDPSFLAVLTGTGESAFRRPDDVYMIPVRTLGA